jgi:hypothetical protein
MVGAVLNLLLEVASVMNVMKRRWLSELIKPRMVAKVLLILLEILVFSLGEGQGQIFMLHILRMGALRAIYRCPGTIQRQDRHMNKKA